MKAVNRFRSYSTVEKEVSEIKEGTLFLFKPEGYRQFFDPVRDMITRTVQANDLKIVHEDIVELTKDQGMDLYRPHEGQWYHERLAEQVSGGQLYALVIEGDDAVGIMKKLLGPKKPEEAKSEAPGSIRGQFVIDHYGDRKAKHEVTDNIGHGSATVEEAEWEISVVFPDLKAA